MKLCSGDIYYTMVNLGFPWKTTHNSQKVIQVKIFRIYLSKPSLRILENIPKPISFQKSDNLYVRVTDFTVFPKKLKHFSKNTRTNNVWKENAKAVKNGIESIFKTYYKLPKLWNIILRYLPFTADENCSLFKSTALFTDTTMNVKNNSNDVDFLFSLIKGESINAQHSWNVFMRSHSSFTKSLNACLEFPCRGLFWKDKSNMHYYQKYSISVYIFFINEDK